MTHEYVIVFALCFAFPFGVLLASYWGKCLGMVEEQNVNQELIKAYINEMKNMSNKSKYKEFKEFLEENKSFANEKSAMVMLKAFEQAKLERFIALDDGFFSYVIDRQNNDYRVIEFQKCYFHDDNMERAEKIAEELNDAYCKRLMEEE